MSVLGKAGCVRVWPECGRPTAGHPALAASPRGRCRRIKCVRRASGRDKTEPGPLWMPEDNPVFILPASDPASPNPEGSASRGNPSLVPWMYHDGATAGLVSRMAIGLPIQSTFKVRDCSGWPGRRRPRPETSAPAQIFSGRCCYERPHRRRKSRS
jgi:hypothetical protein